MSDQNGQMQLPLFQDTRVPEDQDQRLIIRERLDANMMVLAGAGAGKTHELVERMVGLLGRSDLDIRNIVAITFTRKAAGELRSRFYERLQEESVQAEGPRATLLRNAADRIDQCFIGTIHAFCSRLLRERPLEAGLPFDFKELDERDEPRARRQAWNSFLNDRHRAGDARLKRLLEIRLNTEKIYGFYSRRCSFPELQLKPTDVPEPDLAEAVRQVVELVTSVLPFLNDKGREKWDKFTSCAQLAERYRENRSLDSVDEQAAYLSFFDSTTLDKGGITLNGWRDATLARRLKSELVPGLRQSVIIPSLKRWKQYLFTLLAGIVDDAMTHYAESRRLSGAVTFEDLLIKARDILRDFPEVRGYFQSKYRVILVDEFQDTDPIQAEVLMFLTADDLEETDWQLATPRSGSLFVVGDEKQSIYRFRRADVDTFRFVRNRIEATGGTIVRLNTSFRSLGKLCHWLNQTFDPIFSEQPTRYQAEYERLLQYRPDGADELCVRSISFPKDLGRRELVVEQDARRIANCIAAIVSGKTAFTGSDDALLDDGVSYGRFMVLTRNKKHLNDYARALEARGIPYDLVGGNNLGQSEEVAALTQMLEAAADPENPVALVGYLRGPLVGCSDPELLALRNAGARFNFSLGPPSGLAPDVRAKVGGAFDRLARAAELFKTRTSSSAMETLADELGVIPWFAAAANDAGSSRAGALVRLLANVRRWERQGMHWVEIVGEMRALTDEDDYQIAGMTLEAGEPDAVRVMNLHQAKGLQADVVFLADPYDSTYGNIAPDFHVHRFGETRYLSMTVSEWREGSRSAKTIAEPVGWDDDEAEERRFLDAEETRLRYVAATRARNLLVVSVSEKGHGSWSELDDYLRRVEELPEFEDPPAPQPEPDATHLVPDGETRRLRFESIRRSSWGLETVSTAEEEEFIPLSGERRGADYGTFVHEALDLVIRDVFGGDMSMFDQYAAVSIPQEFRAPLKEAVVGFTSSAVFRELRSSGEVFTEAPFAAVSALEPVSIVRGRIDLLFRTAAGWKIIDFKTDAAENENEVERVKDRYREQVAAYADHWSRITGEPVAAKGLWLTHLGRYVPID